MLDYGRTNDLQMLADGMKTAKSTKERENLEKIAYRIMNESTTVKSLRNELIAAFKVRDIGKVKRIQDHMQHIRLEETRGTSWGQNKGEKKIYE